MATGIAVASLLAACGQALSASSDATELRVDGSSTVFPLTREAVRRFERSAQDAQIEAKFSGTAAGFRRFCAGETDISNASREINAEELAQCKANGVDFRVVPLAMDSIAVVVNPANTWVDDISVDELKKLWSPSTENKFNSWRDLRPEWPDTPIVLFGRGQDSGTYDVFTQAIVGTTHSSRQDYKASEDEEFLANAIAAEPNALGFFGIGAYHRHWDTLKLVAVDAGNGAVFPTLETVAQNQYQPLTRPLFLYVSQRSLAERPLLGRFLAHYLEGLPGWIHFTGYMPLARDNYRNSMEALSKAP
nr:PstS family phosphate ABC transporter substrate-binding protein [Pseudomonas mendocina]